VEFAGLGPAPFAAMMLADQGADVIRIERHGGHVFGDPNHDLLNRGKRSITLNLKLAEDRETAFDLIESADVLIEGYRPGVMERLGFGPQECLKRRPQLVYGRVTGWGQDGPLAQAPGHDINYLALTGALHAIGGAQKPVPPLNLVADFGGGGMLLAHGISLALFHVARTGQGQVVEASMVDGVAAMMAMIHSFRAMNKWEDAREANLLDGGAPHYTCYECSDGGWLAVGALEPQFWQAMLEVLELDPVSLGDPADERLWPAQHEVLARTFRQHSRDEWVARFQGVETCVSPVLNLSEAGGHPHIAARGTYRGREDAPDQIQHGVTPRFSATPAAAPGRPCLPGEHTQEVLDELRATRGG